MLFYVDFFHVSCRETLCTCFCFCLYVFGVFSFNFDLTCLISLKSYFFHSNISQGKVYAELTVTNIDDSKFILFTGSGSEGHDLRWLETQARAGHWNVVIDNVTDQIAVLGLAGPRSRDILAKLMPLEDVSHAGWPFMRYKETLLAGIPCAATRISYSGELGWEICASFHDMPQIYFALKDAGAEFGGVKDFGAYAMNSMRLEKGFRGWGAEMNVDTNPLEAGLGTFVKLNKKADFIGEIPRVVSPGFFLAFLFRFVFS